MTRRTTITDRKKKAEDEIPLLEWVVAGVGFVLVAASLGLLLYNAIRGEESPPAIMVRVVTVVQVQNGYVVQFNAFNQGGSTAEGVDIEGELRRGTEKIETSHTTLEYLPSHSERKGGLFFTQDPRQFDLKLRALGYEEP